MKNVSILCWMTVVCMAVGAAGCREFGTIDVSESDQSIQFAFHWQGRPLERFVVHEISVVKQDCSKDCTYWELRRTLEDPDATTSAALEGRIAYGRKIPDLTESISPAPLETGTYSVTAHMARIESGTSAQGHYYNQVFTVRRDAAGLTLVE